MADRFDEVARRIRTLTSVLQKLRVRSYPTSQHREVPKFLSHFVTLLTCGDRHSPSGAKVIAATGSLEGDGRARTLIVTQNLHSKSSVSNLTVSTVLKGIKSFQEVVTGPGDAKTLQDHISDVWAALGAYDDTRENFRALACFVITRSFRKLAMRFNEDKRYFRNHRLFDVIDEWQPDDPQLSSRWVPIPRQLRGLIPGLMSEDQEREENEQVQWELSNQTLKKWATILSQLLRRLDEYIGHVKNVMKVGDPISDDQRSAIFLVYRCYSSLYYFIAFDQRIVQFLLVDTSLKEHLQKSMSYLDTNVDDDLEQYDSIPERQEDAGTSILRYLNALVAWHDALDYLCSRPFVKLAVENLLVGIAEVPYCNPSMLSVDELINGYRITFGPEEEGIEQQVEVLREEFTLSKFFGTVHAEATLMGLLAFVHHNQRFDYGSGVDGEDLLSEFLKKEDTTTETIAVSKKCCWCCERLATLLETRLNTKFTLPGTHGLLYTWSPPTMGIDISMLLQLEKDLWLELRTTLSKRVAPIISHQSSGSSPLGQTFKHGEEWELPM